MQGKVYRVSIYENTAIIERISDGEKKEVGGLLWGEKAIQKSQPKRFFDDESNIALFLMNTYYYALIDIHELFEEGEEYEYEKIEGGVFKSPYVLDRTNASWSLDGVYPENMIRGRASNDKGELDFIIDFNGARNYLITSNKKAPDIITLRIVIGSLEARCIYQYK